jgi:hypothetical protein
VYGGSQSLTEGVGLCHEVDRASGRILRVEHRLEKAVSHGSPARETK